MSFISTGLASSWPEKGKLNDACPSIGDRFEVSIAGDVESFFFTAGSSVLFTTASLLLSIAECRVLSPSAAQGVAGAGKVGLFNDLARSTSPRVLCSASRTTS